MTKWHGLAGHISRLKDITWEKNSDTPLTSVIPLYLKHEGPSTLVSDPVVPYATSNPAEHSTTAVIELFPLMQTCLIATASNNHSM
jgi:hypothetical protein